MILGGLAPFESAQAGLNIWTSGGPEGGSVKALAIDPQTPGVVFAGSLGGSVFKSTTGGNFWTRLLGIENRAVEPVAINVLAIDSSSASANGQCSRHPPCPAGRAVSEYGLYVTYDPWQC